MEHHLVVRVCGRLLLPFVLLFALYIQTHGDYSPGGGFQAGVVFASAFILYGLFCGADELQQALPAVALRQFMALGLLLYIGVGLAGMMLGGQFLDYSVLPGGQHSGILLVEFGVGITVAATMILFFHVFTRP